MCYRLISAIRPHIHHLEDHAACPARFIFDFAYFCMEPVGCAEEMLSFDSQLIIIYDRSSPLPVSSSLQ
jgi:hypothetical protein